MVRAIRPFGHGLATASLLALALAACHSRSSTPEPAPTLLLSSATGGPGLLGELTALPLDAAGAATTLHTFSGTPWIEAPRPEGHGLVWNDTDGRFYGVLNGGGAYQTGVLVSFDPAHDALLLLKTLSAREFPARAGPDGALIPVEKASGYFRRPLVTLDGKGLLLLASRGGADDRGFLIHVDLDATGQSYLAETVVYDFFDHEVGAGTYCDALRSGNVSGQTELAWGKDAQGHDVVYLGRVGIDYTVNPPFNSATEPGTCHPYAFNGGTHDQIKGRMFSLRPTDPAALAKPWAYEEGYGALDPLLDLGRQLYWDTRRAAVRWSTSGPGNAGQLTFHSGAGTPANPVWGFIEQCYRLGGMLPLDTGGGSIVTCSGLNGSDTLPDSPPRIFHFTSNELFDQQAVLGGWYADRKFFRGATSSLLTRRLFANGGFDVDDCFEDSFGCAAPSTIEELDPVLGYPERLLVTGDVATTGRFFFGDPGVGGSVREPIADRWVVWFGAEVNGASNTINKYDRLTDLTVTIPLDPLAGAFPKGRLLDLGNGTALGYLDRTPPAGGAAVATRPGGYHGAHGHAGSRPGNYLLDLKTGAVLGHFTNPAAVTATSLEPVLLDDGSLWVAYSERFQGTSFRSVARLDPATGAFANLDSWEETWSYQPADPFTLAGRGKALYLPLWDGDAGPATSRAANVALGCVRADDPAVTSRSAVFGPASAASGNAHQIVYGATYAPANDAVYLATAKVAGADQGTIFEIDKGVAAADLCRARPVVTALVTGLADVPSTRPLATRAGALVYGTANGKLMRLDAAGRAVALVADLQGAAAASSEVRGYLAEVANGVVAAVVHDRDAAGKNTARRLVSVTLATGAVTSRDVTALIDEFEPYPGVLRRN